MNRKKLQAKPWYATAVAICVGVVLYVLLTRLGAVWGAVRTFAGFFAPVFLGCVIAYLVNPLARFYAGKLFRRVKKEKRRTTAANLLAFVTVVLFIALVLLVILPQLVGSVVTFVKNLEDYYATLEGVVERWGLSERLDIGSWEETVKNVMETVLDYFVNNTTEVLNATASTGKGLVQLAIGFILSVYLLAEKARLKAGLQRLLNALLPRERSAAAAVFLRRCDAILNRYIVFNLLDSLIVGLVNALFMVVAGMPYVGLVSFAVAVTNLIPTFGPVIGAVIGGFVLVLVKPWYALAFLAFTAVLQTCDGYIIKPRLFGNSLGVSGLWILIAVVVGGRMFGALGMLAAIPVVAILDYIYRELFLPWLERRRARTDAETPPAPREETGGTGK